MTISKRQAAFVGLTIALAIASYWFLPHQDLAGYGRFADDRGSQFHARNVLSNAAFLAVGAWFWTRRRRLHLGDDSPAALALFGGVVLTAFGSAYFHLHPLDGGDLNRFTLLWDRIPMTIAFGGLLALVLRDRFFERPNGLALPLLVLAGMATVLYWYWSGDLFPYAFFQLYAAAGTLSMIVLLPPRFTEAGYLAGSVVLFGLAKVFEDLDGPIFCRWGIGGHPLKHVAAALAALMVLLWLEKRRSVPA